MFVLSFSTSNSKFTIFHSEKVVQDKFNFFYCYIVVCQLEFCDFCLNGSFKYVRFSLSEIFVNLDHILSVFFVYLINSFIISILSIHRQVLPHYSRSMFVLCSFTRRHTHGSAAQMVVIDRRQKHFVVSRRIIQLESLLQRIYLSF